MTPEQFQQKLKQNAAGIKKAIERTIPVKVGRAAKDHFQENFEKGGFVNNGLHPWQRSKRIGKAKGAAGSYKTLLSGRNHLFSSIEYTPGPGKVTISNDVPYARVHNDGGIQYVKPHHRTRGEKRYQVQGYSYKAKKRQFMGESHELNDKVKQIIETEIDKALR